MLLLAILVVDVALVAGAVSVSRRYDRSRGPSRKLRLLAFIAWAALIVALTVTFVVFSFAGMDDGGPD